MTSPRDEDDVWAEIVANYGDRPELDDLEEPGPPVVAEPERVEHPSREVDTTTEEPPAADERYVPPPPPPVPRPAPPRLVAWAGLFGVPPLSLLLFVLGVSLSAWVGSLLLAWFVGGFVYLVASMRDDGPGDHDDGAVV